MESYIKNNLSDITYPEFSFPFYVSSGSREPKNSISGYVRTYPRSFALRSKARGFNSHKQRSDSKKINLRRPLGSVN